MTAGSAAAILANVAATALPMSVCPLSTPSAPGAPLLVGFSGGLDSTVLLHWLASNPAIRAAGLRALHVHHGLQAAADAWAAHCQQVCDALGIELKTLRVQVHNHGQGPEAAARDARRQAFADSLQAGQWLALAHHQDDQAETFLLRALRGSGCDGLAAMQVFSRLGPHRLWRPLLEQPRSALHAYALQHRLHWIDDPSNDSDAFDRNFLRQQVMPLLQQRWPQAAAALALSARRCGQDSVLLLQHDQQRLQQLAPGGERDHLPVSALLALGEAQRARLLRRWLQQHPAPPLPGHLHRQLDAQVLSAGHDRQACIGWAGGWQLRRWRDALYLLPPLPLPDPHWQAHWDGRQPLRLPDGSHWQLQGATGFGRPLRVSLRRGGERLRLPGRNHHTALKDCLQQLALPPWQRPWLPLLWDAGELLAAGAGLRAQGFAPPLVASGATLQLLPHTAAVRATD